LRKTERLRVKSDERRAVFVTFVFFLMGIVPDNTKTNDDDQKVFVLAVLASLRWQERPSGRAAVLMTACEKTLVDDIEDVGSGQGRIEGTGTLIQAAGPTGHDEPNCTSTKIRSGQIGREV
jgi:hypothetical protein